MHRAGLAAAIVAIVATSSTLARADDDAGRTPGDGYGKWPLLEVAAIGGVGLQPVAYTADHGFGSFTATDDNTAGVLGLDVHVHADLGAVLFNGEAIAGNGGLVSWGARGQIVFQRHLGGHGWANLVKSVGESQQGDYVVRTSETYLHRHIPWTWGVTTGVTLLGLDRTTYSDAVDGSFPRDAATSTSVEVGFTVMSPQLELLVAPTVEVSTGSVGLRWAWKMGLPAGRHIVFFRFTGDHHYGGADPADTRTRISTLLLFALGVSSNIGT